MSTVTVHEAKTHLSRLIKEAVAGGEVLIAPRGGAPVVKLVAVTPPDSPRKRILGDLAHLVPPGVDPIPPEFWDPLPEEELALWEGRDDPLV